MPAQDQPRAQELAAQLDAALVDCVALASQVGDNRTVSRHLGGGREDERRFLRRLRDVHGLVVESDAGALYRAGDLLGSDILGQLQDDKQPGRSHALVIDNGPSVFLEGRLLLQRLAVLAGIRVVVLDTRRAPRVFRIDLRPELWPT